MVQPDENAPTPEDLSRYGAGARVLDTAGIVGFFVLAAATIWRAWTGPPMPPVAVLATLGAGYVAADLFSGLVHWFFDTWLSVRTPLLGPMFVRPFREHHVDPLSITRHDFVEVNGSNCLATCPVLVAALAIPPSSLPAQLAALALVALCFGIFCTNQFHRWAHLPSPPRAAKILQDLGLVLGRAHHAVHHQAPYARHYCITTGWLNPVLDSIGFFRGLERVITGITGARARAEDASLT